MHNNFFHSSIKSIIKLLVPNFHRKPRMLAMLNALSTGTEHAQQRLVAYRESVAYDLRFGFQRIYMEHFLNDKYDPTSRGIQIITQPVNLWGYRYNELELRDRTTYNLWRSATTYSVDDRVWWAGKVYKALQATTGNDPASSPLYWEEVGGGRYMYNRNALNHHKAFVVQLPASMTLTTALELSIRASVDKFNIVPNNYEITQA